MNRIHLVLKEKGMKQIQLAQTIGVTKSSVSQWCSNTVQPPLSKLNIIADAIGCDVTDLIVSNKKKQKNEPSRP
jgi:transcriptional regulator with XRE-family HTH domain